LRQRHELGVEQVAADRRVEADAGRRHLDDLDRGQLREERGVERVLVGKGALVGEEHGLVGDGDDIVVEGAGGDRLLRLGDEQDVVGAQPVEPGDGSAGLTVLAGGEGAAGNAVDEDLDARRVVRRGQPHVVGGTLVAERGGDGGVDREVTVVGEGDAQLRERVGPFVAAMRHRYEVGDGQVAAPVSRIGRWRDGRGVGRPHRRGRGRRGEQAGAGGLDRAAHRRQPVAIGAAMRQQHALA
jgi:hypothetical protein